MRLGKFLRRSRREQKLLVTAFGWVVGVRVALWLLPFRILRPVVESAGSRAAPPLTDERLAAQVGWAVTTAARFVPQASCVTQAVAARMLLARLGLASELCYGVGRAGEQVIAHAWLESGGRVIVGNQSLESLIPLAP
ncbi:MAG TPA: lasso peptide biosynthesis B2 protein, partial [Terriglobales bacterium]|nr:lasso peptide biosynthesis B2 protein [Terriglobales bacterium]